MSSVVEAAIAVLSKSEGSLHYNEISRRILDSGLWETDGKTPEATVNAALTIHIKKHGALARLRRIGRGIYELTEPSTIKSSDPTVALTTPAAPVKTISFTDAAESVLHQHGGTEPMHYREITTTAMKMGLISTSGRTPEATMYASVMEEIKRYRKRGEQPRFYMPGKGMIGLAKSLSTGIPSQIDQHNREVRSQLHSRLMSMKFDEFEELIGVLLAELGFEEVSVTPPKSDKGVDVRGTLVVGEAVRIRMAVQVKRWKDNVQGPIVQQVRGSLGTHEQGLIITTSNFSAGARKEAVRRDAAPVGLMNGQQLINLLLEHEIGVHKASYDLFQLDDKKDN